ncbi:MAG: hypothetical protein HC929_02595 [Leptolyngbyaceae cyanobacterium SM2_5_2]|nr:hypothetical protein [Leptolyngbyaceae cyanobacterium SM2_5_2]
MANSPAPISPWQLKPWWCQPWSIVLTGVGLILGSWVLLHRWWVTLLVAIPVGVWMGFFVLVWPRLVIEASEVE